MSTITLIISGQAIVISGEGLTVEVKANSSGMASEAMFAANEENGHVDSSALRASSAVKVGATNSPETATNPQTALGPTHGEQAVHDGRVHAEAVGRSPQSRSDKVKAPAPVRDGATNSNTSKPILPGQLDVAGAEPPPSVPATLSAVPAAETTGSAKSPSPADPVALIPVKTLEQSIRLLRPGCRHPDNTALCGGNGRRLCRDCAIQSEAA